MPKADTEHNTTNTTSAKQTHPPLCQEDAVEAFKELLAAAGVGGDDSWDSALRRLIHDARYNAIPSIGERKAVFNEWVTVGGGLGVCVLGMWLCLCLGCVGGLA
jgi:hypothetical protein